MTTFWLIVLFALWGALMTPVSIALSGHYGMMDYPNQRKIHRVPVPRGAGVVLWSGLMMWGLLFPEVTFELRIVLTGATIVFYAGYIDDMLPLSPFGRLAAQFGAACLFVLFTGDRGWFRSALLMFWIAGVTNAYNFIDGLNGLSLTMAFLSCCFSALVLRVSWAVPVAAMIAGVFFWNFPNAKTFVGDGGVYLLGYFLSASDLIWLDTSGWSLFRLVAALLLIGGVPVIDTLAAITRRLLAGKSPFYPDRSHVHHRLIDRGFSPAGTLALLAVLQAASLCLAACVVRF